MENLTQSWTFFSIFKKGQGRPPPVSPSCTSVNVDWYASISLNIPKSSWKCLNNVPTMSGLWLFLIVLHVWQALKMSRVLNVSEFWIWHGCICKGYIEFWMFEYGSVCLNTETINNLFFLTTLNEQLGLFWKCKTTKFKLTKNIKKEFLSKNIFV